MATPSLAMIPSAYADSKVYSVLPNNGDGDFTFNRDSSATRVGQNGLIQTVGYFGNNLVTNGDFATDSDWTKGSSWTISGGTANSNGGSASTLSSTPLPSLVVGKTYKTTYTITSRVSGATGINASSSFYGTNNTDVYHSEVGTYVVVAVCANASGDIRFYSDSFNGSIDNVSVVEVQGDQPRLNYDISNEVVQSCPSLLLEPASTNLVLNSTTGAYGNPPASELITTAPDGTNTAIIPIPNSTSDRYEYQITGGTYATDTKLTYSWYSKQISQPSSTYVGNLIAQGLTNATQVGTNIKVKDSINGWAKYSATFNITDGSASTVIRLYFGSVVGVGNQSVAYWGHQLEALSYCTSLIPTNGASQTRAAETCSKSGLTNYIGQTEGTVFAEINVSSIESVGGFSGFRIYDGTTSNSISFIIYPTGRIQSTTFNGGSLVVNLNFNNYGLTSGVHKIAVAYKENDYILYVDGSLVGSDVSATVPTVNQFDLSYTNGGSLKYNQTRIFKTRLTDAQLQTLTTL